MALVREAITMWTDDSGIPKRFVWDGRRYRVSDTPTAIESDYDLAATHPLDIALGWRFQGTGDDGRSLMFEARFVAVRDRWLLLRTYD